MESLNPYASKVFDKLVELKQWQCQQNERLIQDQETQREVLFQEQKKRFQVYGPDTNVCMDVDQKEEGEEGLQGFSRLSLTSESGDDTLASEASVKEDSDDTNSIGSEIKLPVQERREEDEQAKPKFQFLRKGKGLSRFRMTPEDISRQRQRIKATIKSATGKKIQSNATVDNNIKKVDVTKPVVNSDKPMPSKPQEIQTKTKKRSVAAKVTKPGVAKKEEKKVLSFGGKGKDMSETTTHNVNQNHLSHLRGHESTSFGMNTQNVQRHCIQEQKIQQTSEMRAKNIRGSPVMMPDGRLMIPRSPCPKALHLDKSVPRSSTVTAPESYQGVCWTKMHEAATSSKPSWSTMLSGPASTQYFPPVMPTQTQETLGDSFRKIEQRELRMFERLERIAADSSFCSSSSVVTKFVEGGYLSSSVQSTPQVTPSKQHPLASTVALDEPLPLPPPSNPFSNEAVNNARALLEKLAAFKFSDQLNKPQSKQEEGEIQLELRPLQGNGGCQQAEEDESGLEGEEGEKAARQHVRFNEHNQVREVLIEREAWRDTDSGSESYMESSQDETDSEEESVAEELPTKSPDPEDTETEEGRAVIGSLVHARLEELQREVLLVQREQSVLASQRAELAKEKQRLAEAVASAEREKQCLEGERRALQRPVVRRAQSKQQETIEQLSKQLTGLQAVWKEKEARWAAAQASQRAQLRQLALENKQLAFQIKTLSSKQGITKKVHFAPSRHSNSSKQEEGKTKEKVISTRISRQSLNTDPGASSSLRLPATRALNMNSLDALDTAMESCKDFYPSDCSPSSSLLLDTPQGISKAYHAIFQDREGDQNSYSLDLSREEQSEQSFALSNSREAHQEILQEGQIEPNFSSLKHSSNNTEEPKSYSTKFQNLSSLLHANVEERSASCNSNSPKEMTPEMPASTMRSDISYTASLSNGKLDPEGPTRSVPEVPTLQGIATDRSRLSQSDSEPCRSVVNEDGSRQLWFPSGNTLKISADSLLRRVVFYNGDIQETLAREGMVRYFYAESQTWHETSSDGTQTIFFPDGQKEVVLPCGRREVLFADRSTLRLLEDGSQQVEGCSGAKLTIETDGTSTLLLPNGLREVRTKESTRLEYPDGTVRTKYPTGLLETKYANGRVRVKDSSGKLIMDTHSPVQSPRQTS